MLRYVTNSLQLTQVQQDPLLSSELLMVLLGRHGNT